MTVIGFHCSHQQISPAQLLRDVQHGERAGLNNVFGPLAWDLETVQAVDVVGRSITPEQVRSSVRVSSELGQHAQWLAEYVEQGWDELFLYVAGQRRSAFGERVLPQPSPTAPTTTKVAIA